MVTRDVLQSYDFQHLMPSDLNNKKSVDSRAHQTRKDSSSRTDTRRRSAMEEPYNMRSREDLRSYDIRRLMPSNANKNNMRKKKLDSSAHNTRKDFSTHTTGRNEVEDDISYYSHSDVSLPAYSSTQIGIGLQMVDCCGSSSNRCRGDSKYAYFIIILLSVVTIFQTCRIYGLYNDISIGGNLRALNMSKNGNQVNFNTAIRTSDTMTINSMSNTEKGAIRPINSGGAAAAMENSNGIMVPINNSILANQDGMTQNMQQEQTYSNGNMNTMGINNIESSDGSSNMNDAMMMSQQRYIQRKRQEIDPFAKFLNGGYGQIKPTKNGMNGNMNEGLQNRSQRGALGSQDTTSTTDTDKKKETQGDKMPSPTKSPTSKSLSSYGARNSSYGTGNFTYTGGRTTSISEDKNNGSEIGGASGGYAD